MNWTIGVDVGGTFTDFYAFNPASGELKLGKWPSTPADPAQAILRGLEMLAADGSLPLAAVKRLAHGTTVGTNALIQRRGGKVALITTRGFRDLLEIGRQTRPHMYDLNQDQQPALIRREHRLELAERIGADGAVVTPIDQQQLADLVTAVSASGADACAVCLLFSYLNPQHERAVADTLAKAFNGQLQISISSAVQPEFREYERFSTTVLNAYLQSVMTGYIERLEQGVLRSVPNATLGINQSGGGLMSAARARAFPVRTALSGPAAGVVGAVHVAKSAGRSNIITLDMGGTSADVALIRNHRADIAYERQVAGFPIRLPMVDIETVGAGGGSVAWFDRDGLVKVGPASAGADPGPACYGRGGTEPTVTDANLLLGRLSPRGLIGGDMALDLALARDAFAPMADRLGASIEHAARGVLGIVVANMVRTIRTISVERGYDPKEFVLMPFGGAGPLHARDVAHALGMTEVLVPPAPGIVCAQGLVVSDQKEDFVISQRVLIDPEMKQSARAILDKLFAAAEGWFQAEDIDATRRILELRVDARYVGQNFELEVPVALGADLDIDSLPVYPKMKQLFFAAHETSYGYFNPDDAVEVVNFRLTARGAAVINVACTQVEQRVEGPEPVDRRDVCFDHDNPVEASIFDRDSLEPGHRLTGPAIIEQLDTTTPVYPGDRAQVDGAGNILIRSIDGV